MQINNGSKYSYGEILKGDFDLTKFENINQLIIGYYESNGYYEQSHTVSNIKQKMASAEYGGNTAGTGHGLHRNGRQRYCWERRRG